MTVIIDENYEGVKKLNSKWYVFNGNMHINDDVLIKINLIVKGSQTVEGHQTVEGYQIVENYQLVEGSQIVSDYQIIQNLETKFSLHIINKIYHIHLMSNLIRIGCKSYSPNEWNNFTDDEINEMDENALKWWGKKKNFVLNKHNELCKIHG